MYKMINSADVQVNVFESLSEVARYLMRNQLYNIIHDGESFEIADDNDNRVVRFWHNEKENYTVATGDGYLYEIEASESGPNWTMKMDNGNNLALPIADRANPMPFEAVLAVLGIYRGFNYFKEKRI